MTIRIRSMRRLRAITVIADSYCNTWCEPHISLQSRQIASDCGPHLSRLWCKSFSQKGRVRLRNQRLNGVWETPSFLLSSNSLSQWRGGNDTSAGTGAHNCLARPPCACPTCPRLQEEASHHASNLMNPSTDCVPMTSHW